MIFMAYNNYGSRRFNSRYNKKREYIVPEKKDEKPKVKPVLVRMPKSLQKVRTVKTKAGKGVHVISKRKSAVARAIAKPGTGKITINKVPYTLISNKYVLDMVREPILLVEEYNKDFPKKLDIKINVAGGGVVGQYFAARNCIAKAFVQFFNDLKLTQKLIDYNRAFLVDDIRRVESKKPLGPKARAKKQHSKR